MIEAIEILFMFNLLENDFHGLVEVVPYIGVTPLGNWLPSHISGQQLFPFFSMVGIICRENDTRTSITPKRVSNRSSNHPRL